MSTFPARPNFLFIMTDQQRFDAISAHGGWIKTPVIDQLAREGIDLRSHYSQAPVCVPSRATIFTGRYPHAHRVLENDTRLAPHEVHLFKCLKQEGYHLTYSGKNHLLREDDARRNFDHRDGNEEFSDATETRKRYIALERESLARLESIGSYASSMFHDFPDEVTSSGRISNQACSHLAEAPIGQPWCVVASFSDPHVPHLAPRRFAGLHPLNTIPLPDWPGASGAGEPKRIPIKRAVQNIANASATDRRLYLAVYGAMCSYVDELIGRMLDVLRSRPDADRTVVVFLSDHGDFAFHHNLCKKDLVLYDDLLHVPAVLHCPARFAPRTVTHTLTGHVDIMPTLLDLAGISVPSGCQGRSLVPLLRGETDTHRDVIHAEICHPGMRCDYDSPEAFTAAWRAARGTDHPLARSAPYNVPGDYTKCLRTRRWKYIWFGDGFEELYDLQVDPAESHNLATDPAHQDTRARLNAQLLSWLALSADPRDLGTEQRQLAAYGRWRS